MTVGDLVADDGRTILAPGIDRMSYKEFRYWKMLYLRRAEEARPK